jgi:hypothetical protein
MRKSLNDKNAELPGGERQHDEVLAMVRHGQILIRIRLSKDRSELPCKGDGEQRDSRECGPDGTVALTAAQETHRVDPVCHERLVPRRKNRG